MRYAFVRAERANYPVIVLCRCMEVSQSGFYEWLERGPSLRSREDDALLAKLTEGHKKHRQRYGSRRHRAELAQAGTKIGRNRVRRLMGKGGLQAKRRKPYKVTTKSDHDLPVAPNHLNRNFQPAEPDQAWVGDLTYIRTSEGWLYLAIVLDLFSRKVVGWAMSARADRELVMDALRMALGRRSITAGLLLFHSDRGCQYASDDFRKLLKGKRITPSMSRRANCWDNAVAESFFATLETELLDDLVGQGREAVKQAVFEYIEAYYNPVRLHSTLGYLTPCAFERKALIGAEPLPWPTNLPETPCVTSDGPPSASSEDRPESLPGVQLLTE